MLIAYIIWSIFIRPFKSSNRKSIKLSELTTRLHSKFPLSIKMLLVIIVCGLLVSSFNTVNNPKGTELINDMIAVTRDITSMSYKMQKTERICDKYIVQTSQIKWNRDPFMVYVYQEYPNNGLQVLFKENENNNKAKIDPNGFPWVHVNLDPLNHKMRKNQHHTIFESGYDYFIGILDHMYNKYGVDMGNMLQNKGLVYFNNRWCWAIEMDNTCFKIESYTVKEENMTPMSIAKNHHISEYMIRELNGFIMGTSVLVPGTDIKKPNDYARKMNLLIDRDLLIPCLIETYDNHGLFERYEISNVMLNPKYTKFDFCFD